MVGHSLGGYAALYAAGVLSVAGVIYLMATRATLLETRCTAGTHAMLAIKGSLQAVEQLIHHNAEGQGCELACANQPTGHVDAGPGDQISKIARAAAGMGIETVRLNVPFAFTRSRSSPSSTSSNKLQRKGFPTTLPRVPVSSPLLVRLVPAGDGNTFNASYLAAACRGRVDFAGALAAATAAHADDGGMSLGAAERTIWLEIGSHPVCSGVVKGTLNSHTKTVATLRQHVDSYDFKKIILQVA